MALTSEPQRAVLKPDWLGSLDPLPWAWASERLKRARNYWLVSTRRDGFPQARPVWGLWDDHLLFLSIGGGGLGRTEAARVTPVTVHLGDAAEVVIVEGALERTERDPDRGTFAFGDALPRLLERWNAKYGRDWTEERHGLNVVVRPTTVLAWREAADRTNADASGKWTFEHARRADKR